VPIDTFKGRRTEDVVAWFKNRPQEELEQVEVVVLEMSKAFYAGIREIFARSCGWDVAMAGFLCPVPLAGGHRA
jgi:hypothetical protein